MPTSSNSAQERGSARHREINNRSAQRQAVCPADVVRMEHNEAAGSDLISMSPTSDMPFDAWHGVADFKASTANMRGS